MTEPEDKIALIDLDGTAADYDTAMQAAQRSLQAPDETPYGHRYPENKEPPHMEARRKMIQRQPDFWRNLKPLALGFEVIDEMRKLGFSLHVLTKGPRTTPNAWGEKLNWCLEHIPDAVVTVTGDKSIMYGRILFDDYPPYFSPWLAKRPRGLVVCPAHPWNERFAKGGPQEHPRILRYDGSNRDELLGLLTRAYERRNSEAL